MRKRYAIPVVLLLAVLAAGVAYLGRPAPPGPGVTWANAARIEMGMAEAEVVAIVAIRPPRESNYIGPDMIHENESPNSARVLFWSDNECDIIVYLNSSRRVVDVRVNGHPPPTWASRARRRLGL